MFEEHLMNSFVNIRGKYYVVKYMKKNRKNY